MKVSRKLIEKFELLLNTTDIIDALNSTVTDKPLSANQGKVLNDKIDQLELGVVSIEVPDIVNNLTTDDATKTLSAAQGKALKDILDAIEIPDIVDNLTTEDNSKTLSAAQGKVLKDTIDALVDNDTIIEIVDNLTSTDVDKALSAKQGKVLKDDFDSHKETFFNSAITIVENGITEIYVSYEIYNMSNNGYIATGTNEYPYGSLNDVFNALPTIGANTDIVINILDGSVTPLIIENDVIIKNIPYANSITIAGVGTDGYVRVDNSNTQETSSFINVQANCPVYFKNLKVDITYNNTATKIFMNVNNSAKVFMEEVTINNVLSDDVSAMHRDHIICVDRLAQLYMERCYIKNKPATDTLTINDYRTSGRNVNSAIFFNNCTGYVIDCQFEDTDYAFKKMNSLVVIDNNQFIGLLDVVNTIDASMVI